jgi:3-phosphoshikimate 1-carboxyvinyltransferase
MQKFIRPSQISGNISAPPSKSMMQRATALALLASGRTVLRNPSDCADARASLQVAENLGAKISVFHDRIEIEGGFRPRNHILECGEAGLCVRMFAAIAALAKEEIILSGAPALRKRPVGMLELPLNHLGARCESNQGFLPVKIKGPLRGGETTVDGSISSQFLSGLLIALPLVPRNSVINVLNLKSKPYIDLTLKVIRDFGAVVENQDYQIFQIPGGQHYRAQVYTIEGDWSGAAFLLVVAALAGELTLQQIAADSPQADRTILKALTAAGASVSIESDVIRIQRNRLEAFEFDATDCPDLFPPLVALACHCRGTTRLKGINRLIYKESNRALALQQEFAQLGCRIQLEDDWMEIPGSGLKGGTVQAHNDHRIVMALAVAGILAKDEIKIVGAECVTKSYGRFFEDLQAIGGKVHE